MTASHKLQTETPYNALGRSSLLSLIAIVDVLLTQSATPIDRLNHFLGTLKGCQTNLSVTIEGYGKATGTFSYRRPDDVRIRLAGNGFDEEFLQCPRARILFEHDTKEYSWYGPSDKLEGAPPDSNAYSTYGYPSLLTYSNLGKVAPKSSWTVTSGEEIAGQATDLLSLGKSGDKVPVKIWIDKSGRPVRMRTDTNSPDGPLVVTMEFTNLQAVAPAESTFEAKLPEGYLPSRNPMLALPSAPGDMVRLGLWRPWPEGQPTDMDQLSKSKPLLVAVTSADMGQALLDFAPLADAAKAAGATFVQLWVGAKPADEKRPWPVYWDEDGQAEKALGLTVTPWFYGIRSSKVESAWMGWDPAEGAVVTQSLLAPLFKKG